MINLDIIFKRREQYDYFLPFTPLLVCHWTFIKQHRLKIERNILMSMKASIWNESHCINQTNFIANRLLIIIQRVEQSVLTQVTLHHNLCQFWLQELRKERNLLWFFDYWLNQLTVDVVINITEYTINLKKLGSSIQCFKMCV